MSLFSPLALPHGAVIPNRIAKAAMEENMADGDHAPSAELLSLYRAWAEGEARTSKMVFIGIDLPKDIFLQGLEQCLA